MNMQDDPPQDEPDESNDENSDASAIIKTWDVDLEEFLNNDEDGLNDVLEKKLVDEIEYKWMKIRNDISIACGQGGLVISDDDDWYETDENSVDLSEFDCDPDHSQAAGLIGDEIWLAVPPDVDDMFSPDERSEEEMEESLLEDSVADYDFKFDEALYKIYTGNRSTFRLSKLWGKCLVPFVIIFLLILIPMILYGYVYWIKSMMP